MYNVHSIGWMNKGLGRWGQQVSAAWPGRASSPRLWCFHGTSDFKPSRKRSTWVPERKPRCPPNIWNITEIFFILIYTALLILHLFFPDCMESVSWWTSCCWCPVQLFDPPPPEVLSTVVVCHSISSPRGLWRSEAKDNICISSVDDLPPCEVKKCVGRNYFEW